jgi:hypothetical protein
MHSIASMAHHIFVYLLLDTHDKILKFLESPLEFVATLANSKIDPLSFFLIESFSSQASCASKKLRKKGILQV